MKQQINVPNLGNLLQTYEYDSLNRLTLAAESTGWRQGYKYDRWGNRQIDLNQTWGGPGNTQFDMNEVANTNRIYAAGPTSDTSLPMNQRQMRYDASGNLTYDTWTGQGERVYDAENRMIQARGINAGWQYYTYDGDGRRVKRNIYDPVTMQNTETWQVYGVGGELIAEYAANGAPQTPKKEYGYRNGQLLITATVTAGGWGTPPVIHDNPLVVNETTVQARHISELREAINALRSHLNMSPYSWQYSATTSDLISANPILEMRIALDQALGPPPSPGYSPGLAYGQLIKAIHIQELRNRVLSAWNSSTGGVDIRWLVTDQLGTPRMVLDQSGNLSTVSRHDYLPFGEELVGGPLNQPGTGGRVTTQGYTTDNVR